MAERWRALLVEDDQLLRSALETLLVEEDFEVRAARHGAEALGVLSTGWTPGVILLDLTMPDMNGEQVRARQRVLAGLENVPVVVISGARDMRARAHALDAAPALSKPFELDDVISTIRDVLLSTGGGVRENRVG